METIFQLLCGCLDSLGGVVGLDYKEVSVYVCIYLWPWLCCLAAAAVNVVMALKYLKGVATLELSFMQTLMTGLSSFVTIEFFKLKNLFIGHYEYAYSGDVALNEQSGTPNTVYQMFDICQEDLIEMASDLGMTYAEVNIYIYCYLFGLIMLACWVAFECVYPGKWLLNRLWRR